MLRRVRSAGVQIAPGSKRSYYDFYDSIVRGKLGTAALGLADEVKFLRRFSERTGKVSITAGTLYQKHFVQPCDVRTANLVQLAAALAVTLPLAALEGESMRWVLPDGGEAERRAIERAARSHPKATASWQARKP